jgi:hypothetical protein
MGSFTNYMEKKVMDAICGNAAAELSSISMWLGLFTAAPSDASGGTEVSGGNYARKSVGSWLTVTVLASGAGLSNVTNTVFDTATGAWGDVSHFALFDDSETGNMIMWSALTVPQTVVTNDIPIFNAAV